MAKSHFSARLDHQGSSQSLDQDHAAFMPDANWAIRRLSPTLSRINDSVPVRRRFDTFRHVISGSLAVVFLTPT